MGAAQQGVGTLLLGILVALASTTFYSFGVTFQSLEARLAPSTESLHLALLGRLVRRKRWIAGTACVVTGWALQAASLTLAPITVVQPTLAAGLIVLLIIGVRMHEAEGIGVREIASVVAITIGVTGLALTAPGESSKQAAGPVLAIGLAVLGGAALLPYLLRMGGRRLGLLVVFSAGLAYAWTGFSTKFLADALSSGRWLVLLLWLGATIVAACVGLLSEMTALQTRSAIGVFPIVLVVQIVIAVLLAPLLAGEEWQATPLLIAALGGSLAVLTAGAASLATCSAVCAVIDTEGDQGEGDQSEGDQSEGDQGEGDSGGAEEAAEPGRVTAPEPASARASAPVAAAR